MDLIDLLSASSNTTEAVAQIKNERRTAMRTKQEVRIRWQHTGEESVSIHLPMVSFFPPLIPCQYV